MTDPIRSALAAAGCTREDARKIAAFLRAMPEDCFAVGITFDDGKREPVWFSEDWHMIAIAVEQAVAIEEAALPECALISGCPCQSTCRSRSQCAMNEAARDA